MVEEVKELQSVHSENVHHHAAHALKHEKIAAAVKEHSERLGMGKYAKKSHAGDKLRRLRATLQWQMAEDDFKVPLEGLSTATERLDICNARLMKISKMPGVGKADIAMAHEEQAKVDALFVLATKDMDKKREGLRRKKEQAYLMGHGDPMPDPRIVGDTSNGTVSAAEDAARKAQKEMEEADLKAARRKSHMMDMTKYYSI